MLAIQGGKIFTAANGQIERGTILIDGGRITAVGARLDVPADADMISAEGKWITPGFIDPHTHISLKGEPATMPSVSDVTEITSPITPAVRAIDALNPADPAIQAARDAGFTTCCTLPGSGNLIGGRSVVFKTRVGSTVFDLVIPGKEQMKMALGENPRRIHGGQNRTPMTRLGNGAMLREALFNAKVYADQLLTDHKPAPNFQLDALVPVVRGEMRCRIHCHRADDIVTAVRIAEEFGLWYSVEHVTEGWKILDFLREKNVSCVVGPLDMGPEKMEIWNCKYETPGLMEKAGVEFCLTQDARSATKFLPVHAGIAMTRGLSFDAALRAMTINPANLLGVSDRVGTIEPGKDADLAIFSGNPFSNLTVCEDTFIDGILYEHNGGKYDAI